MSSVKYRFQILKVLWSVLVGWLETENNSKKEEEKGKERRKWLTYFLFFSLVAKAALAIITSILHMRKCRFWRAIWLVWHLQIVSDKSKIQIRFDSKHMLLKAMVYYKKKNGAEDKM